MPDPEAPEETEREIVVVRPRCPYLDKACGTDCLAYKKDAMLGCMRLENESLSRVCLARLEEAMRKIQSHIQTQAESNVYYPQQ